MQNKFGKIIKKNIVHTKVRTFSLKERIVHHLYEMEFTKSTQFMHIAVVTNDNKKTNLFGINIYEAENPDELIEEMERK